MNIFKNKNSFVLCAMSFIVLASSATSPALAIIANNFPNASVEAVSSIATLSSLTALPFTIISGLLIGKKIRYKTMACLGLVISFIGGLLPFFCQNITELLFGRAILGMGTGLLGPIVSTLTLSFFSGERVAKQFSLNMMATSFGAVIFQLIGGYLCKFGWRMPFLTYLIILPVLLIVVFLLKEPSVINVDNNKSFSSKTKFSLSNVVTPHVLFWGILHGLYMMFFYPFVTETSQIVVNSQYGSSMTVAIILSLHTAFGVIGGYLFYPLNSRLKMKVLSVGFSIGCASYLLLLYANNAVVFCLISCFWGIGYGMISPGINYYLGRKIVPKYRAFSIAVASLFQNFGSFCSPFVLGWIKKRLNTGWDRTSFLIGAVFFIIAAILFIFKKFVSLE